MKQLGPYKKFIIAAAVIQSILVIIVGYVLFKSKAAKDPLQHQIPGKMAAENPQKRDN